MARVAGLPPPPLSQDKLASLPEALAAGQAYQAAAAAAEGVNNQIQDVLLMPGFPPDSACDLCKLRVKP